jgi:hypothetical protein
MSADAVSLTWYGAIRGRRLLQYEAIGMFVGQVLTACGSLLSVWVFHAGVPGLVVGLLLGELSQGPFEFPFAYIAKRTHHIAPDFNFHVHL